MLHNNNGTSFTPYPSPNTPTHTYHSFYDERLLGCKFLQYLSEAQNHADKFLVAFLLIELYHTSFLNFDIIGKRQSLIRCLRLTFTLVSHQV